MIVNFMRPKNGGLSWYNYMFTLLNKLGSLNDHTIEQRVYRNFFILFQIAKASAQ